MDNQNRNLVKTTITIGTTLDSIIIMLPRNANSTYGERDIYLHPDGETIDYIHYYDLQRIDENSSRWNQVKPHYNHHSRKTWDKYASLFDEITTLLANDEL